MQDEIYVSTVIITSRHPLLLWNKGLNMRLSRLLLTTPLFLIACSSTPPPQVEAPVVKEPTPVIKQDFSKVLESNFRGQLTLSNGKGYFKACDTSQEFYVDATPAISDIYKKIASTSFTPVYVEFAGEITFTQPKSKDNNVEMRIDRVHHMALAKASLQCAKPVDTFQFRATGDEPYWRINIDKEQLYLSTKASNQAYDVENSNFRSTEVNKVYAANKKAQKLKLNIQPGHCYDTKNNEYWGYKTEVDSVWGEFNGCGEPGWPVNDQPITGYYLSTNNGVTSNLTLNSNFTVKYTETIDGTDTVKTGYWKTNSPKTVSVMLAKQAEKDIRQELIFDRNGLALSSAEINDENIVTPLTNGLLTFNRMNAEKGVEAVKVNRINREFIARNITPSNELDVDIQKAVNNYFNIHRTDPKNTQFSAVKYDLNGDGVEDAIVLLDWCSNKNGCEVLIFEGRDNWYRFSSRISHVHAPMEVSRAQYYLWQSLLVKKGDAWATLDFDGLSYPVQSNELTSIEKEDFTTDIVLFSDGKPTKWFPIKM